jgi:hypothetical protein
MNSKSTDFLGPWLNYAKDGAIQGFPNEHQNLFHTQV